MSEYAVIGKVVPLHKGEYQDGTAYGINDIVTYNRSTYWHHSATETTGVKPTDSSVWQVVINYQEMARQTDYTQTDKTAANYLVGKDALDEKINGKMGTNGGAMQGALTVKGIILTKGVDYFDELPETVTPGKLIFVKDGDT